MKQLFAFVLLITLTAATDLYVLEQGRYACAAPGDAIGPAINPSTEWDFIVTLGSSYRTKDGKGPYLLTGHSLIFTSGPFKSQRFHRSENGLWRKVAKTGEAAALSCSRIGPTF